jgi:hypothetical protein
MLFFIGVCRRPYWSAFEISKPLSALIGVFMSAAVDFLTRPQLDGGRKA